MTNPLARAPEPPEPAMLFALARALAAYREANSEWTRNGDGPDVSLAFLAALLRAGYRIVPESPARTAPPVDFPIFGVGNTRYGLDRHDKCSIHGEIGVHTSIAAHIKDAHGMTYEQYRTLEEMYGLTERDLYLDEDIRLGRWPINDEPVGAVPESEVGLDAALRTVRAAGWIAHEDKGECYEADRSR